MDAKTGLNRMTRREFMLYTGILAGATALTSCTLWNVQDSSPQSNGGAMEKHFLLGVSTSIFPGPSISEQEYALLTQNDIESVEIGYEQGGPALLDKGRREKLVALVQDARPPVFSLHAPYRPYRDLSLLDEQRRLTAVEYAAEAIELASQLGAKLVVLHGSEDPISPETRADRLEQGRKSLADLVPRARALDLRLALETMPPEWLPATRDEAFAMVQDLDPEVIGFCLDTNHSNLTEGLPELVRAMGSRLWNVHISDNDGLRQQHWMPMEGIIDWKAFLVTLDEVNYQGPLHYELDPHPDGPEQGLKAVKDNFMQLLALASGESGE